MSGNLENLETRIGYRFKNKHLLRQAMTHSSYANERHWDKLECNERLEFLGDAVLELVSSDFLFHSNPSMKEGEMTKQRASMVCEPSLAYCAQDISLGEYLRLGKGEDLTGGRERHSIVSDAMEALIGAIYLDGGFTNAKEFIHHFVLNDIDNKKLFFDSKTILQEMVQSRYEDGLTYVPLNETGPDHQKRFEVAVCIGEREIGRGAGSSKKAAEQMAAYKGILSLKG